MSGTMQQGAGRTRRPLVVAWGAVAGRSAELAAAVGGDALCCYPPSDQHRPSSAPVRWSLSALKTLARLVSARPSAVIVTNPPIFASLTVALYTLIARVPLILDDHPGSFGTHGDRIARRLLWVHRRLVRVAALCLVTSTEWVETVQQWGGAAAILHESPSAWGEPTPPRAHATPTVLFVSTFSDDEPVLEALGAAGKLRGVRVIVTGDHRRRPRLEGLPENVEFSGLMPFADYQEALRDADVVLALTTEPTSAMRAAFEAVWAERPLVVTDWPLLEELFPDAVRVSNDPDDIARGVAGALAERDRLNGLAANARQRQLQRWNEQLMTLQRATRGGRVPPRG